MGRQLLSPAYTLCLFCVVLRCRMVSEQHITALQIHVTETNMEARVFQHPSIPLPASHLDTLINTDSRSLDFLAVLTIFANRRELKGKGKRLAELCPTCCGVLVLGRREMR